VGTIAVSHVGWRRPGGAELLTDVSFHVGNGEKVALVGANGVGKTTLVRLLSGELDGATGTVSIDGRLGVMRQLVGSIRDATTVRQLLVELAPERIRRAGRSLIAAEAALAERPDDATTAVAYAQALHDWGETGGYDAEVFWDRVCTRGTGTGYAELETRPVSSFSGGEQKRLALTALLDGDHDVLLLDEPDNFLDIPGKRWLEEELRRSPKTVLYVSHDRELLAATATKIVTIEAKGAWTHGGGFATYHEAREARLDRQSRDAAHYEDERQHLVELVNEMRRRAKISDTFAPRLKAAETRLRHFDESNKPPELVREQRITVRLRGDRTGKKALTIDALALDDLTYPFSTEIWFGERVAVLGPNGAGKSHFLRLLAGDTTVEHEGSVTLGARVVPGHFHQTNDHPELRGRRPLEVLLRHDVIRGPAMAMLRRYEIHGCAEQPFETLSGGQQARLQILLLELEGATMLLLDEPTDNLDLVSAEALETGLGEFQGTVLAVTHDRWFLRGFDRFLVFTAEGDVLDLLEPPELYR
jgi:ATPase subunit of ABC transporter with duplicated ATPase domains